MKYPKSKQIQRIPFFYLGLCIALAVVISAFEWKVIEEKPLIDLGEHIEINPFDELVSLPKPPPPVVKVPVTVIEVVQDDTPIETPEIIIDVTFDEFEPDFVLEDLPDEKVETTEITSFAEHMPQPRGGYAAFYKYIGKNLKYPRAAVARQIEGKVFLTFVVDENGAITNVEVMKGFDKLCDTEAVRVLSNAPDWSPGKQGPRRVKVRMVVPITFKLQ